MSMPDLLHSGIVAHTSRPTQSKYVALSEWSGSALQSTSLSNVGQVADEHFENVESKIKPYVPDLTVSRALLDGKTHPPPKETKAPSHSEKY